MWGRENPPLEREVDVAQFGPRELAITWRGASCDANTALVVEGTRDALHIMVDRGLTKGCSGTDVIYDSVLELAARCRDRRHPRTGDVPRPLRRRPMITASLLLTRKLSGTCEPALVDHAHAIEREVAEPRPPDDALLENGPKSA